MLLKKLKLFPLTTVATLFRKRTQEVDVTQKTLKAKEIINRGSAKRCFDKLTT